MVDGLVRQLNLAEEKMGTPSMKTKAKPRGRPKDAALTTRRCEEILEVATRLFATRGYPGTDLQVVADELGVGKGTIYRYFDTKEALFLAAVDRAIRRLSDQVYADMAKVADPLEQVAVAARSYLAFFDTHPECIELLIQERAEFRDRKKPTYFEHREANIGRWHELFRGLVAAGRVRDMPIRDITDAISDLLYGTIFTNYFAGRKEPLEVQAQRVLNVVFCGILSDEERRRFQVGRRKEGQSR